MEEDPLRQPPLLPSYSTSTRLGLINTVLVVINYSVMASQQTELKSIDEYVALVGYLPTNATSKTLTEQYKKAAQLKDTENLVSLRLDRKIKEFSKNPKEGFDLIHIQKEISSLSQRLFEVKCKQYYQ